MPPRGLWTKGALPTWTTTEAWLGKPPRKRVTLDVLVLRYLAAFGPASVADAQAWCGLTRLREVVERLRPRLVTFQDEQGVELFDLLDAPRPPEDTPAPVRFLPQYDNVFLGHADRSRITAARGSPAVGDNETVRMLLVDGSLAAFWAAEGTAKAATLRVTPFSRWNRQTRTEVEAEGLRMLAFLQLRATHEVIVAR